MALNIEKLRSLMKLRRVTQAEIAKRTGKQVRTVNRWFKGENVPKDQDVRVIAGLLHCEPVDFYENYIDAPDEGVALHARVSVASYNAYEMMGLRYGVAQRDIMEIAPVLFSIVAGHALRVPEQDLAAWRAAEKAGLHVNVAGNAEEASGFALDQKAAKNGKCFGIEADPWKAQTRNLFYHALLRLCEGLDGVVDAEGMYQPDAGEPLKAVGFNVAPYFFANAEVGLSNEIATGRVRFPDRETLSRPGAGRSDIDQQRLVRQAKLDAQRAKSLEMQSVWQTAYAAENPEQEAEYQVLAAQYYEAEGFIPEGLSLDEQDAIYANPFGQERVLKRVKLIFIGWRRDWLNEAELAAESAALEVEKNEVAQNKQNVGRLKVLERERRASQEAFMAGGRDADAQ